MLKLFSLIFILFIGCATAPIKRQPQVINVKIQNEMPLDITVSISKPDGWRNYNFQKWERKPYRMVTE